MFVVKKRPPQTNQLPNVQYGVHVTHAPSSGSSGKTSYLSYDDIPKSYRDNIETKLILPIETKLTFTLDKLKTLGTKDSQDDIGIITKTIDTNLSDINKNIESIRLAEARVDIANLGLRGFQMKVDFTKGLQLEIVPGSDNYEMFFDFIRKYVFLYKDSEWPPNINKYEYFKYNSSSRELCCFYWPLYAYVKTLFHNDFKGNVDLLDLFSLPSMQKYCTDFFKKQIHKPLVTTSTKKKGQSGGDNKRNKGQGRGQGNRGQGKSQGQGNRGQGNRKTNTFKPLTVSNKMVSAEAQGCEPSKLSQVEVSLRRTILTSNVSGAIVDRDTEYNALQRIVRTYIRNLKETDLLVGGKSIETFIMDLNPNAPVDFYPDETESRSKEKIKEKCHGKVKITGDTKCIIDPLLGVVFTYDNLKAWFTPSPTTQSVEVVNKKTGKKKKTGTKKIDFVDPCNILINSINMFKENYPLPSPMWKLEMDDLKGIRERFMKVLSFLLITLREMYERLKQENIGSIKENIGSIKDNRKSENEVRSFYSKLIQSIENEQDNTKKQQMIRLQDSIEAKFGNLLVK